MDSLSIEKDDIYSGVTFLNIKRALSEKCVMDATQCGNGNQKQA